MDIKKSIQKIKEYLLLGILFLFPLNQQLHIRPFQDVDGFIIDYLILKISIPEVLLVAFFILNIKEIVLNFKNSFNSRLIAVFFLIFSSISIFLSKYKVLGIYESAVFLILIICLGSFYKVENIKYFSYSLKFWLLSLSILAIFQFYNQGSVLNNYYLFGEFPYNEDFYHIKQKGFLFSYLIPPYAIFSHSNIFGGFILVSIIALGIFRKDSIYFHLLSLGMFLIVGSLTVLVAYFIWVILLKTKKSPNMTTSLIIILSIYLLQFACSSDYLSYQDNYSIYRRLYMFDLTKNYFLDKPTKLIFGAGYNNYFFEVKDSLFKYEIVRFFQPTHNLFNLIIWQYGLLFLIICLFMLIKTAKNLNNFSRNFIFVILFVSMFDHYFITNHQLKLFLFLLLPYSINSKNSI